MPTLRLCIFIIFAIFICQRTLPAEAQFTPGVNNNVTMLDYFHKYNVYSNVWGYVDPQGREYALLGHNAGLSIVDVTNPQDVNEVVMIAGPTGPNIIWREVKTFSHYAYVVSEHRSPSNLAGIQIIDLANLPATAHLVNTYVWPGVLQADARAHTVWIDDDGFLYINGGTSTANAGGHPSGIRIFDLKPDPVHPLPVGYFARDYVHDISTRKNLMFSHNIFSQNGGNIDVVDISDRANPRLKQQIQYPDGFTHNSTISEDGRYLYETDEVENLTLKIFDIGALWDNDPDNDDQIERVGEYLARSGTIAHEPRIKDGFLYVSHYSEGVRVVDVSDPTKPGEVGYYDTYPGDERGFEGNWGVYPYFPSGTIVASDISFGLYVLRFNGVRAGEVHGTVYDRQTGQPLAFAELYFAEAGKIVETDFNGAFSLRTNAGRHTVTVVYSGTILGSDFQVNITAGQSLQWNVFEPIANEDEPAADKQTRLEQSYPNPLRTVTSIPYQLQQSGKTSLIIYNSAGQEVNTFAMGPQAAGAHEIEWNGRNASGEEMPSGVYLYRLSVDMEAGRFTEQRRLVILR